MKKLSFIFFLLFSFSSTAMTPGNFFKKYIKKIQKQKALKGKVKIGEGIFLNLSNPSEKFIFHQMDIKILKEIVVENKAEVFFLITWTITPQAMERFWKKEDKTKLKNIIPKEYIELKKVGKERVIKIGSISAIKGKVLLYKNKKKWSQFINVEEGSDKVIKSYCITHHINEAIELNERRKKLYSALTGSRSKPLSNFLIASEKLSLFAVKMMEMQALPFNKIGIDILCKEMISMKKAPPFKSKMILENFPKMKRFKRWNSKPLVRDFYEAYKQRDFKLLSTILRKEIKKLKSFPGIYCMHRHIVESILRTSNYGPIHKEKAKRLGLNTKNIEKIGEISWNFILSQIITIPLAYQIDKMAFPFQREGIPIICQDVPNIPEY